MAIDFPTSPTLGQQYTFNGVTYVFTAQGVWATAGASAIAVINGSPQGRLTLQTLTPVMTTTQPAKTTIFYTPYVGNRVPIYDGTSMVMTTFAELSVATTDATKSPAAIGASKVNDWFVWSDAGTVRIGHGPDWTSDTARSAGTALTMVNGILLNNASITNGPAASRGTYVGTTRSNASSQLDWTFGTFGAAAGTALLGVWNCYNRRPVSTTTGTTTANWTYATAAWRGPGGGTTMFVSYVAGLAEDVVEAVYQVIGNGAASQQGSGAIGIDTFTAPSGLYAMTNDSVAIGPIMGSYAGIPGLGFHSLNAIEYASGATFTFYGAAVNFQGGLKVTLWA